ncbi:MAG TPA: SMP-30/gluconolactonase/LRE family protein [Solirubrobacterales bacterium]
MRDPRRATEDTARRPHAASVVVECGNELGETPIWDEAAGLLHWVDVFAGAVYSLDPAGDGVPRRFEHGVELGAVAPRASGGLVLGASRALIATDLDGGNAETLVAVEPDRPDNRFNDCRVDPSGRFFCGTKTNGDSGGSSGALYRIDADLSATVAIADTGLANGIGWSPDATTLYFIDSPLQRLDAYEFDLATGNVGARRTVAEIDPDDGLPDGLAVDAEGGIWVALVRGGVIRRFDPDGHIDAEVPLPVANPTCPGFGGPDLGTLYVTSAHLRSDPRYADDHPLAGALFAIDVGVKGVPSPPFAG